MSFVPVSKVLPVAASKPVADNPHKNTFQTTPARVSEAVNSKDDFAALWERINGGDKK